MRFRDGLRQLRSAKSQRHVAEAIRLLDNAVGIGTVRGRTVGLTLTAARAASCLPLYLVRRVEYESAARRLNISEMDITCLHSPFDNARYIGDIRNLNAAVEYLLRAALTGNRFACELLSWLAPDGDATTSKNGTREKYLAAIRTNDMDTAIALGQVLGGGNVGGRSVRPDSTNFLQMSGKEQKATSANNIGYLLSHGTDEITASPARAMDYYRMAVDWGSASAASNMGFMYYTGAEGIARDGMAAYDYYKIAIARGERNYAPRNMGILLQHGAPGLKPDVNAAASYFLLALREGDDLAKLKAKKSLRTLMSSWKRYLLPTQVRRECKGIVRNHVIELQGRDTTAIGGDVCSDANNSNGSSNSTREYRHESDDEGKHNLGSTDGGFTGKVGTPMNVECKRKCVETFGGKVESKVVNVGHMNGIRRQAASTYGLNNDPWSASSTTLGERKKAATYATQRRLF